MIRAGKVLLIVLSVIFLSGCKATEDKSSLEPATQRDTQIVEERTIEEEETVAEEIPEDTTQIEKVDIENVIQEYADMYNASDYFADYYISYQYLLLGDSSVCLVFIMDDFSKVESVDYPNISKIETSEIGELGFLDIYDKTGEKISFTFETEKLKEIRELIEGRRLQNE